MKPIEPDAELRSAGLRPPRFGLKALMWLVALVAAFLGFFIYLGTHVTSGLVLLALAVFAHVAGNALGTRLRTAGNNSKAEASTPTRRVRKALESEFAPATRLRDRSPLGRPIVILTVVGTLLGGVLGGFGFVFLMNVSTLVNVMIGMLATAILGGIWTFIAASFVQVAGGAAWQATRDTK